MREIAQHVRRLTDSLGRAATQFAIFFIVLGAKLTLIRQYAMPHPYWDSWHVEGVSLYKPFLTGTLTVADLFATVSEHRPLVLRLYDLTLLTMNRQWDVQLQMVVNAILLALFGCLLFHLLARPFETTGKLAIATAVAVLFAVPSGWENTLNGHHAGWFFFYIFSIVGIWLTLSRIPFTGAWMAGLACLVLAYLSLFSGVISAIVAAAALALRLICERNAGRRGWSAVALLVLAFVIGMALEPRFPGQANVKASSVSAFLTALGYGLVWPRFEIDPHGLILQVPALVLVGCLVLRRLRYSPDVGFVVALAGWTWLQAIGIAYARGVNGMPPVVRYMEILTIGLLASFVSALLLLKYSPPSLVRRLPALVLLVAWVAFASSGMARRTRDAYIGMLPEKHHASVAQDFNLRSFVETGDRSYLDDKPDAEIAYYGGAKALASFLADPVIRSILPSSIREPLPVVWVRTSTDSVAGGVPRRADHNDLPDPGAVSTYSPDAASGALHLESDWIPPPALPFLQFRVAGDLDQPDVSLALITQSGGTTPLRPTRMPDAGWTSIAVPAPGTPFRIVANAASPAHWFAFSAPREMGVLSFYAERMLHHAATISWIGYACGVLVLLCAAAVGLSRRFWGRRSFN